VRAIDDMIEEPVRGSIGDLRTFQSPGLETFRRFIREDLPGPPISRLLGMRPTEAGLGKATFAMPISPCEVDNAEGKRVAMATSSALVVEGGVCKLKKGRLPEEILAEAEESEHRSRHGSVC